MMPNIANKLTDSVKGQYFRHVSTGEIIEALELIYSNPQIDPNKKFLSARDPITGKFLSIPYKDTIEYLTLSKNEATKLRDSAQEKSNRLAEVVKSVELQYLQSDQGAS